MLSFVSDNGVLLVENFTNPVVVIAERSFQLYPASLVLKTNTSTHMIAICENMMLVKLWYKFNNTLTMFIMIISELKIFL